MWATLNAYASWITAALLAPVASWSWPWQVGVLAVPITLLALLAFRFSSNQDGIRRVKRLIQARLLEMRLFRDDLRIVSRAQGRVVVLSGRYLLYALPPLIIMIVPVVLVLAQVEARFAYRALAVGESAMLVIGLDAASNAIDQATLTLPRAARTETPALRIPSRHEIRWQIRAEEPGREALQLALGAQSIERTLAIGVRPTLLVPAVFRADDPHSLLAPDPRPLSSAAAVRTVEIRYPRAMAQFGGLSLASWALFGLTLVLGFLLRGLVGVTF